MILKFSGCAENLQPNLQLFRKYRFGFGNFLEAESQKIQSEKHVQTNFRLRFIPRDSIVKKSRGIFITLVSKRKRRFNVISSR